MNFLYLSRFVGISTLTLLLISCDNSTENQTTAPIENTHAIGNINTERLLNIEQEPGAWLTGGRDYQQSYYSPLKQINRDNIKELGYAWHYDTDSELGFEATPIVVDGLMFTSGPTGTVFALDAKTGAERWRFIPETDPTTVAKVCCGVVNRGVSVWKGQVFVATLAGDLIALDADSGTINWRVDTITDRRRGYTVTGAPYIAKDLVIIGNSGAEMDARGYITAYDSKTGIQRWRFFTVPGDPKLGFEHPELEMAAKTWDPNSLWHLGLGGTVWDGMAYDPELNLLYIGIGNAAPHNRKVRSPAGGDNLFLSTIMAINPDTGRMVWHYQVNPADNWDYTATQKLVLAELEIEGKQRKVIMQAPKNGFFYVLDRTSGELISAEPYSLVNWASHVDMKTGRPVETDRADFSDGPKLIFPGPTGAHNWQPMSYSRDTGLVYLPNYVLPAIFSMPPVLPEYTLGGDTVTSYYLIPFTTGPQNNWAVEKPKFDALNHDNWDVTPRSSLKAWDPVQQKVAWEVDTSGDWKGMTYAVINSGGVISTAGGIVLQGRGSGELIALNTETGEQLHSMQLGTSMMAAPMTYTVENEQYIAIMMGVGGSFGQGYPEGTASATYGNKGRIIALKLGGGDVPLRPQLSARAQAIIEPPAPRHGSPEQIARGQKVYMSQCIRCHIPGGMGIPDLKLVDDNTYREFDNIVLKGSRAFKGMGSFAGTLGKTDTADLRAFLMEQAWENYDKRSGKVNHY